MSVIRMLSRLCAVAALRGRTWADERVFDSDNTPLSQALMLNEAAKPYIVVYTDADNRVDIGGTDLYCVKREMNLVLELGVASKVEGATGGVQLKTPLTDEGMEIALDMVEEQAISALFGDPINDWTELLKSLVIRVDRVSGQRGASAERDRRWAARQLTFVCDTLADLPPGVPVPYEHPIQQFIIVAKNNPEAGMDPASEICAALINRTAAPNWQQVQAMLGVRRLGLRAIGLAPLAADLPDMATAYGDDLTDKKGEAPILREISYDDMQMELDLGQGLVDLQTIRTNVLTAKPVEKKDKVEIEGEQSDQDRR
jgi:hypothetical protein